MTELRNRRIGSIKSELVKKSGDAALSAVRIFNRSYIIHITEEKILQNIKVYGNFMVFILLSSLPDNSSPTAFCQIF
jgi:hypothetical protein